MLLRFRCEQFQLSAMSNTNKQSSNGSEPNDSPRNAHRGNEDRSYWPLGDSSARTAGALRRCSRSERKQKNDGQPKDTRSHFKTPLSKSNYSDWKTQQLRSCSYAVNLIRRPLVASELDNVWLVVRVAVPPNNVVHFSLRPLQSVDG